MPLIAKEVPLDQIHAAVEKAVVTMLKKHGGMGNGYCTSINGKTTHVGGTFNTAMPKDDDLTNRQIKARDEEFTEAVREAVGFPPRHGRAWPMTASTPGLYVEFESKHVEHGCNTIWLTVGDAVTDRLSTRGY